MTSQSIAFLAMADKEAHLQQADHNIRFLSGLDASGLAPDYSDWVVTVSFYAAVHLVEAAIAGASFLFVETRQGSRTKVAGPIHSDAPPTLLQQPLQSPHRLRKKLIDWNPKYMPGCSDAYADLLEMSFSARYSSQTITVDESLEARTCLETIRTKLASRLTPTPVLSEVPTSS